MAIIGKIREKSGITIVLLGLAMFAFIMSGWDNMFGSSNQPIGLGEVYGEKVDPMEYEKLVQSMIQSDQQQYAQQQYMPQQMVVQQPQQPPQQQQSTGYIM